MRDARILVLLTHRPEFDHPLAPQAHVTSVALARLRGADASELVRLAFREQDFAPDVLRKVIEKTDGVPLYIEEFTKAVVESRQAAISAATSQVVIPASLHDSLLARLDLLGEAKGIAQLASMLGREFDRDVLAAVWTGSADSLSTGLARLVQAEFIYRSSDGARERYLFKHALIQDAAYESLLKSSRVAHHRRIAEVLERQFANVMTEQPEVVAHHYAAGRVPERAAQLWFDAGQRSLRRNAHVEAAAHLRSALATLAETPDTPQRSLSELDMQITLGTALVAAKGYASPDVEATWSRAQQLCAIVGRRAATVSGAVRPVDVRMRGRPSSGRAAPDREYREAGGGRRQRRPADRGAAGDGHLRASSWANCADAQAHFERVGAMYDPHATRRPSFSIRPGPGIGRAELPVVDPLAARRDRRRARDERAGADVRARPRASVYAVVRARLRRLAPPVLSRPAGRRRADRRRDPALHGRGNPGLPVARPRDGRMVAMRKRRCRRVRRPCSAALDFFRATGSRCFLPYWDAFHADALSARGDHAEAGLLLDHAFAAMEATDERWAEAELHRIRGLLLERRGEDATAIEGCHRRALASARQRGAKAWELRAAASLASCLRTQGRTADARAELAAALSDLSTLSGSHDFVEATHQLQSLPA